MNNSVKAYDCNDCVMVVVKYSREHKYFSKFIHLLFLESMVLILQTLNDIIIVSL